MRELLKRKNIGYGAAAAVLLALLSALVLGAPADRSEKTHVRILALGDSVFGLEWEGETVPQSLERLLGESIFNGAFGGANVCRVNWESPLDRSIDALSLVALTRAAAVEDFGVQQTLRYREVNKEYYESRIDELAQVDFTGVELVLIQQGLNDYYSGVPLENQEDPYDEYSFKGALRSSVRSLRRIDPEIRILLVSPTYVWDMGSRRTCEEYNSGYGNLEAYVQAQKEVAEEMGLEFLDLYHDLYPHDTWEDWKIYSIDGMHPNGKGRELIAERIAEYLQHRG